MSWIEGQTLTGRWEQSREVAQRLHPHWDLGASYGYFAEVLAERTGLLKPAITKRLRSEMLRIAGPYARRCRWVALAADGSRIEAPHTEANEAVLGCAGREKTAPQVYLTTLWHMGLGLPWDFRLGPGTSSERAHLAEMLDDVPRGTLIVADAGFVSYDLCRQMITVGLSFLLRVGNNVHLLTELGWELEHGDDVVYLWPQHCRDQPPLVLRLIRVAGGKQTIYLLTNVLDQAALTNEEAAILYRMRWGVEVFYRSYKQTLDRHKLLSRTPATCLAEACWTMIGLWLLGLLAVSELLQAGTDPLELSVAAARNAVRRAMRSPAPSSRRSRWSLSTALASSVKDGYVRRSSKTARNYPRKKQQTPPGPPKIKPASAQEIQHAQRLKTTMKQKPRAA